MVNPRGWRRRVWWGAAARMVADQSTPSPASHLIDRDPSLDIDEATDADEDVDEDPDEASVAAAIGGGPAMPLGAGPNYPKKSKRGKQPPSWHYFMKALNGHVIDPEF